MTSVDRQIERAERNLKASIDDARRALTHSAAVRGLNLVTYWTRALDNLRHAE